MKYNEICNENVQDKLEVKIEMVVVKEEHKQNPRINFE